MSVDGWSSALVLGGIRSGKSAFAESLVAGAGPVRRLGTEELSAEPGRLATAVAEAKPDEVLLVDDLGGWVTAQLEHGAEALAVAVHDLAQAVRGCAGRLVLVSPEVGFSVAAPTVLGRAFAEEIGAANQALAEVCDAVVLVVAGQPAWLKGPAGTAPGRRGVPDQMPATVRPAKRTPPAAAAEQTPVDVLHGPTMTLPALSSGMVIQPGMELPMPDEQAAAQARDRLQALDVPGAGFGALAAIVSFAAGTQGSAIPRPWQEVRVLLVHGDHEGGAAAGDSPAAAARRAAEATAGEGAVAGLAADVRAGVQVVPAPTGRAFEVEDTLTAVEVDQALAYGWRLAEAAADDGVELLVLAACGAGAEAAAAAVTCAITGSDLVAMLDRVWAAGGRYDDEAWMARCAAVRDALHRTRLRPRSAHDLLAGLGGGDIAVATGILLGAAARRTPVLLDGPVGVAAGLASRDIGGQARHWCLLPDDGGHPTVRHAATVLDLTPVLDLRLGLGEGAASLAALPLLRSALALAATLPSRDGSGPPEQPATGPRE
jgi:nicotinate-nucleotide--dimethylbenzimidazole phosphoribosyltransferase